MSKYQFGVSTFILVSPFTDRDVDQFDVAKEMGYDLIEVCIEDPAVVSAEALKKASERTGLPVSICGAFGPDRDVSHEDPQKRRHGVDYLKQCVDIAQAVGGNPYVWARNLLANRLYRCPVVFLEPYVMNSQEVWERVQAGDYEGERVIAGSLRKSIYREYADALAAYVSRRRARG